MCALKLGDRALALDKFEKSLAMRLRIGKTQDHGKGWRAHTVPLRLLAPMLLDSSVSTGKHARAHTRTRTHYPLLFLCLPAIAASYNNIAIIHKREGRYEQALETYNQALELQKVRPIHTRARAQTHTDTHTHTQTLTDRHRQARAHTHTHTLSLTNSLTPWLCSSV